MQVCALVVPVSDGPIATGAGSRLVGRGVHDRSDLRPLVLAGRPRADSGPRLASPSNQAPNQGRHGADLAPIGYPLPLESTGIACQGRLVPPGGATSGPPSGRLVPLAGLAALDLVPGRATAPCELHGAVAGWLVAGWWVAPYRQPSCAYTVESSVAL